MVCYPHFVPRLEGCTQTVKPVQVCQQGVYGFQFGFQYSFLFGVVFFTQLLLHIGGVLSWSVQVVLVIF